MEPGQDAGQVRAAVPAVAGGRRVRVVDETHYDDDDDDDFDNGGRRRDGRRARKATEPTAASASRLGTPTTATQPKPPSPTTATAAPPPFAPFGGRSESSAVALVAADGRREERQKQETMVGARPGCRYLKYSGIEKRQTL